MVWMMTMCNVSLLEQRLSVSWTRILFIVIVTLTYWMDYCITGFVMRRNRQEHDMYFFLNLDMQVQAGQTRGCARVPDCIA